MYSVNQPIADVQNRLLQDLQNATTATEIERSLRGIQRTLEKCFHIDGRAFARNNAARSTKLAALKAEHARRIDARELRHDVAGLNFIS